MKKIILQSAFFIYFFYFSANLTLHAQEIVESETEKINSVPDTEKMAVEELVSTSNDNKWPLTENIPSSNYFTQWGMGLSAAKIYQNSQVNNFIWGIDADILNFNKIVANTSSQRTNQLSLGLHFSYRHQDGFLFNSKLRLANDGPEAHSGGSTQNGSFQVDYAYIEHALFSDKKSLNIRIGNQLIPMGLANLQSELLSQYSVLPADIERFLIPYNWNENGVLFVGQNQWAMYHVGLFNSLDGSKFKITDNSATSRNLYFTHKVNSSTQKWEAFYKFDL